MTASVAETWAELSVDEQAEFIDGLDEDAVRALLADWQVWGRPEQHAPPGEWSLWAYIAGRGAGKTRSGAEFVLDRSEHMAEHGGGEVHRVALVGRTAGDVRDVIIEGESGLIACAERRGHRIDWEPSKRRVTLPELLTTATTFSAAEPESLRGPQHHTSWADEVGAWKHIVDAQGNTAWTNLQFGMRLDPPTATGMTPQTIATTTPKPIPLVIDWFVRAALAPDALTGEFRETPDPRITVTRGSMYDNIANLSSVFIEQVTDAYSGTRLGAQEIMGDLLSAVEGALWQPEDIGPHRWERMPSTLGRKVVGVDPPGSATGAECGIIVAGSGLVKGDKRRHAWVLEDGSVRGRTEKWASVAVALAREYGATIVGEVNNGGDMVRAAVHAVDPSIPYKDVRATRRKLIRAEPVSLVYQQGRVHHVGTFGLLESQMMTWVEADGQASPDRMDALVWAIHDLLPGLSQPPASVVRARGQLQTGAQSAVRRTTAPFGGLRVPNAADRRG